jgi:hypothetical protein
MAKKKKKDKKLDMEDIPQYTLDSALKAPSSTKSDLQTILKGFSEEKGYISPQKEDEKIEPKLSYESKKKIAEDYMMEQVPLTERPPVKERIPIVQQEEIEPIKTVTEPPSPPESTSTKKEPSFAKRDNIYEKLAEFFEDTIKDYSHRYEQWENSVSSILAILRKMRKITKKNTEDMVSSINNLYQKIQAHLEQFKVKRDQIEKVSGIDIESMSSEFKKVLGLLELQVKEYQLKRLTDEFVHQHSSLP